MFAPSTASPSSSKTCLAQTPTVPGTGYMTHHISESTTDPSRWDQLTGKFATQQHEVSLLGPLVRGSLCGLSRLLLRGAMFAWPVILLVLHHAMSGKLGAKFGVLAWRKNPRPGVPCSPDVCPLRQGFGLVFANFTSMTGPLLGYEQSLQNALDYWILLAVGYA